RTLGATIEYRNGYYFATAPGRLRGTEVRFPLVSVMGTENVMLAATLADGHTVIRPAAQEPEVDDLIEFLQKMGAEVERTYPDTIEVRGNRRLRGADHRVIPDRIEAGTFVIAGAVTGGSGRLTDTDRMGARTDLVDNHRATIRGRTPLRGTEAEIGDLRAGASLILAALAADGQSTIHGAHHVQRGYENIERKFADLGARIAR